MKRLFLFCVVALLLLSAVLIAGVVGQAQPPQAAKQKKRGAKNKVDSALEWVWKNPQTPAHTQFKTFKSATLGGQEVSYLFWAPPGYDDNPSSRFPVAYFLHGGGGNYTHIPEAFLPKAAEAIQAGTLPPFIGIVVNGLPSSFYVDSMDGKTPVESILMKDLLPQVDATYRTSGVRLIEGFSMGGRGAT
jgi:endo-1,4-beta-xylanase